MPAQKGKFAAQVVILFVSRKIMKELALCEFCAVHKNYSPFRIRGSGVFVVRFQGRSGPVAEFRYGNGVFLVKRIGFFHNTLLMFDKSIVAVLGEIMQSGCF